MEDSLRELNLNDEESTYSTTALHLAVKNKILTQKEIITIVKVLLNRDIDPEDKHKENQTLLCLAIAYRLKDVVNYLMAHKVDTDSAAHFFVEGEYITFQELLSQMNSLDEWHGEILRMEAESVTFVEWMISKGFDFDCKNKEIKSALQVAIERNLQHILPVLSKYTKDIGSIDRENKTLLHLFLLKNAAFRHYNAYSTNENSYSSRYTAQIVKFLLDRGVSPEAQDIFKRTPIRIAISEREDISVIEMLIERYTNIHNRDINDETLFHVIIRLFVLSVGQSQKDYYLKISRALIAKGADVNEFDKYGYTPLYYAVNIQNVRAIEFLIANGADPCVMNNVENLLEDGAIEHPVSYPTSLMAHKINLDLVAHAFIRDEYKNFQKFIAEVNDLDAGDILKIESECAHFVEWLLSRGFDFDWKNQGNLSALYLAIEYNLQHILPVLLKCTKDINLVNKQKKTLLHLFIEKNVESGYPITGSINKNWYSNRYAVDIVKILLDRGVSADAKDKYKWTPIQVAVSCEADIGVIEMLLERCTKIHHKDPNGHNLLQRAIKNKMYLYSRSDRSTEYHLKVLRLIVAKGADVGEFNKPHRLNLLQYAVENLDMDTMVFLHENGVNTSEIVKAGENLLHLLARSVRVVSNDETKTSLFDLLISKGCQVNARDKYGNTPLHNAVVHGNVTIARKLIECGANVNYRTFESLTPLQIVAMRKRDLRLVELFRETEADFGVMTKDGENLLHLFAKSSNRKCNVSEEKILFGLLVAKGCQLNGRDVDGRTPLHVAVGEKLDICIIELFRESGADFSATTNDGKNVMHFLAENYRYDVDAITALFNLLVSGGCQIDVQDVDGITPLCEAVCHGNVVIVEKLIGYCADVKCKARDGKTLLQKAVESSRCEFMIVKLLRKSGADVSVITEDGKNLIHLLAQYAGFGDFDDGTVIHETLSNILSILVSEGCQLEAKDCEGNTPLHVAARSGQVMIARKLIELGVNVNSRNNEKETPLLLATKNKAVEVMKVLLNNETNVNAKDSQGRTSLHLAASNFRAGDSCDTLLTLLEHGADVNAKDRYGLSVLRSVYYRDAQIYDYNNYNTRKSFFDESSSDEYSSDEEMMVEHRQPSEELTSDAVKVLVEHSIKLLAADLQWPRIISTGYYMVTRDIRHDYRNFYEECLKEIDRAKINFVDDNTSLYTLLHVQSSRRCAHVNKKRFKENLREFVDSPRLMEEFPKYSVLILASYREAVRRKSVLELAKEGWLEITKIRLPEELLELIFSFLSDNDLFNIAEKDNDLFDIAERGNDLYIIAEKD